MRYILAASGRTSAIVVDLSPWAAGTGATSALGAGPYNSLMLLPTLLLACPVASPVPQLGLGKSVELLNTTQSTEHFKLHARPGSRAAAALDRTAFLIEREYAHVLAELDIEGRVDEETPFYLFLYDSVAEMDKVTEAGGSSGFSAGRESHIPFDNDQTRLHELVHIVVAAMPREPQADSTGSGEMQESAEEEGAEPRNMFFAEGLANAVLVYVTGVHVHAVAAYEHQRGSLPELSVMARHLDFYRFLSENRGLNGYDIAGSYFRFLLDRFSPRQVMDYYHGKPLEDAFGVKASTLEADWVAMLDEYPLRPALFALLSRRRGDGGEFTHLLTVDEMLGELLGEPQDWVDIQERLVSLDKTAKWTIEPERAFARNKSGSDWSRAEVPDELFGDCVLRAKVKLDGKCWGIKLRYGQSARGMVLGQGAFLYSLEGGVGFAKETKLTEGRELDMVLHVQDGRAALYVDGLLVVEAKVRCEPSRLGIGLVGGKAEFSQLRVRKL